jgi:hypothetical protein
VQVWGFDRAVLTDGVVVNLQLSPEFRTVKDFCKREKAKANARVKKKAAKAELAQMDVYSRQEFPHASDPSVTLDPSSLHLTNDPGKSDLMSVTDGVKVIKCVLHSGVAFESNLSKHKHYDLCCAGLQLATVIWSPASVVATRHRPRCGAIHCTRSL